MGDSSDPIVLSDVFARVGGPNDQNVEQVGVLGIEGKRVGEGVIFLCFGNEFSYLFLFP